MATGRSDFFTKVWRILTPRERRGVAVLTMLITVSVFLEALGLSLVVPAIVALTNDDIAGTYPALEPFLTALGNPSQAQLITWGLATLVVVYFAKTLYLVFLAVYQTGYVFNIRVRLSEQLYLIYLNKPWTFHLQRNSSQLIRNILGETQQIVENALTPSLKLIAESLLLVCLLSILLIAEPVGALTVATILGVLATVFYRAIRRKVTEWGRLRQYHEGFRIQHLVQGLSGVKDVKLLAREDEFLKSFRTHNRAVTRMTRKQSVLSQMPRLWLEFLAVLGLALLVGTMIYRDAATDAMLPTLALFAAVAFRLMPSINKLVGALQTMRYGTAAVDNIYEELALASELVTAKRPKGEFVFHDRITLEDVEYCYPEAAGPALSGVTLNIRHGESIGLIGESGSGKSTLVDLLLGVLEPTAGEIRVDGRDIHSGVRDWQRIIGYVPQSIYLTDDTLRRNIAFGLPDEAIDDDAVQRALAAAQLDQFVATLEKGVDTFVGEDGVRLSGGQRQRIGIARALYHDPEVLVLDEATSALDNATEQEFMNAVVALHGKKTTIIVAHRLTTVADCDRIYRLQGGRVVEEGSARNVLANAGIHLVKQTVGSRSPRERPDSTEDARA